MMFKRWIMVGWLVTLLAMPAIGQAVGIYYLHSDQLNTPRVVTDEQNRIVWRNAPLGEPFGTAVPEEDPDGDGIPFTLNLRFPGQYFDRETNLSYNYFRDYDSQVGRYIQSDPIGLAGGINTFAYVGGNPLGFTDPSGLCPWCVAASGGAGAGTLGAGGATTWWGGKQGAGGKSGSDSGGLFGDLTSSHNGASSSQSSEGSGSSADSLSPPGKCTLEQHRQLQDEVNATCKTPRRCDDGQDCETLKDNYYKNFRCAQARDEINNICFGGGNAGHRKAAQDARNAAKRCLAILQRKKCDNCPVGSSQ